jgi:hypothetical protein
MDGRKTFETHRDALDVPRSFETENSVTEAPHSLRPIVDNVINLCALVLKQRDCYGSYLGISGSQYVIVSEIAQAPSVTVTDLAREARRLRVIYCG